MLHSLHAACAGLGALLRLPAPRVPGSPPAYLAAEVWAQLASRQQGEEKRILQADFMSSVLER